MVMDQAEFDTNDFLIDVDSVYTEDELIIYFHQKKEVCLVKFIVISADYMGGCISL